jgi:hypothetical protein
MSELDEIKAKLCVGEFSHLHLTWNDYSAPNYMSVADGFEHDAGSGPESQYFPEGSFVGGAEEKKRCAETNSVWTAHWYPETPVGFCVLHAATFETLLKGLREEVQSTTTI